MNEQKSKYGCTGRIGISCDLSAHKVTDEDFVLGRNVTHIFRAKRTQTNGFVDAWSTPPYRDYPTQIEEELAQRAWFGR